MKSRKHLGALTAMAAGLLALMGLGIRTAQTQTSPPTTYEVTDVGPICSTTNECGPWGINDSGAVVGQGGFTGGLQHAFLYPDPASPSQMKDLGTLGGNISIAFGINEFDQVVGYSQTTGNGETHAFLYTSQMDDLDVTLGGKNSRAHGINDSDQVVGESDTGIPPTNPTNPHAFLYPDPDNASQMKDLGTLGGFGSTARAINNSGAVVGESQTSTGSLRAFLYTSQMQDLGTLGGDISDMSTAYGINDSGQVVGQAETDIPECSGCGGERHAFLYPDPANPSQMKDLGTLSGDIQSHAIGINNSGVVVGRSGFRAFLYDSGSATPQMQDLNGLCATSTPCSPTLGPSAWTLSEARAINTAGQIAAIGAKQGVGTRALLLTPSAAPPEDTTPPTTTASATTPDGSYTSGDWTNKDVTVTLTAADNENGSGVDSITYSASGAQTIPSTTFTAPFTITNGGTTTITYHAVDQANNTETDKTFTVKIDKQAPSVLANVSPAANQTKVPLNFHVFATFDDDMNATSVTTSFKLDKIKVQGSKVTVLRPITATVNYPQDSSHPRTAELIPGNGQVEKGSTYRATITTTAKDKAGNTLQTAKVWTFQTGQK